MKKLLVLLLLFVFVNHRPVLAQNNPVDLTRTNNLEQANRYFTKAKHKKTAAVALLGTGLALVVTGIIIDADGPCSVTTTSRKLRIPVW